MNIGLDLRSLYNQKITGIEKYTISLVNELLRIKSNQENYFAVGNSSLLENKNKLSKDYELPTTSRVDIAHKYLAMKGYTENWDIFFSPYQPIPERRTYKGVITVHDCLPLKFPDFFPESSYTFFDVELRKSLESVDHIITVSNSTKKDIIQYFNVDESKITVTHLSGLNTRKIGNLTTKQKKDILDLYKINGSFILSVCTFEPRKNLIGTIKAYQIIRSKINERIKLVLVGGLGWHYNELLRLIDNNIYKEDIVITGYIPETHLPILYEKAMTFVYPSFYEGFGLPVLEAMGCGAVVVTSNVSSLPEVGGEAVLYCDPFDVESIADAIMTVILSNDLRDTLSNKGIERSKLFTWEKTASKTLGIFYKVLNEL
ncbi:glycosyltransferase family 1 protein [Schinkia azotoformans]|uniref:glycosyltransferase family 4 protein n=1 Tax=Schinkia azotoformans TaxID=1454 RepID=UPI002E1B7AEE|nr:glycosyltransferase family 1 protein [Schinkia azotoformans]